MMVCFADNGSKRAEGSLGASLAMMDSPGSGCLRDRMSISFEPFLGEFPWPSQSKHLWLSFGYCKVKPSMIVLRG